VPHDLAVVGFDDLAIAGLASPRLTTIHQPLREMAEQATRIVLQLLDDVPPEVTRIELATRLVVRDSTAPPRSRVAV
jgi:LacI family xylobiose transport system transcriptional regulator